MLRRRPDLAIAPIRGNVDTRLAKLAAGEADALVLALCGLERLDRAAAASEILDPELMLPAVGQGALAVECRAADQAVRQRLAPLNDLASAACVTAERAMLTALDGSCRTPIGGISGPQIIPFLVRHHFERQLVMVAQEDRPLAFLRDLRRLTHDVADRKAVLLGNRHVHPRHQRKVERHVAFVAIAEIFLCVFGPLVCLGQQHPPRRIVVECLAQLFQYCVSFGQVFIAGALALDQIGHRVEAHPVDAKIQPEVHDPQHFLQYTRIIEVQVGLMRVEAVPVICFRDRIPRPVRGLYVDKDDPRVGVGVVVVRPDIVATRCRTRFRAAGALKPDMVIGRMVDHQFGDDADIARVGARDDAAEIRQRAVIRMHSAVIGDVIAVIAAR